MEQVLQNINRLNRNLESIITVSLIAMRCGTMLNQQVGNEFGSVEALWSQFENFMGRPEGENADGRPNEGHDGSNQPKYEEDEENTVIHER